MNPLAPYFEVFGNAGRVMLWVGVIVVSIAFGGWLTGTRANAEMSRLRAEAARDQATIAEHASRRLLEAQARGDELTTQLHVANRAALLTQEKLDEALRRATTGRACLNGPALRLLDGAHGLRVDVPEPARGPAAADGPAPAYPGELVASDTDVARWIARAGLQYDECRRRLDALIAWQAGAGS